MISTLLLGATLLAQPAPPRVPSAAELLTSLFAKYHAAHSLTAKIRMTQSVAKEKLILDSTLAYERPSKVMYEQRIVQPSDPRVGRIVSDGDQFTYQLPPILGDSLKQGPRAAELVGQRNGTALTVGDIISVGRPGMLDKFGEAANIMVARREDLEALREQWETVAYVGRAKFGDETVHRMGGKWRPYKDAISSGTFEIMVGDDGLLRRYAKKEILATPDGKTVEDVVTVYDVQEQQLDPAIPAATFQVLAK